MLNASQLAINIIKQIKALGIGFEAKAMVGDYITHLTNQTAIFIILAYSHSPLSIYCFYDVFLFHNLIPIACRSISMKGLKENDV
jgi:hypothetical protein